jgi:hypothetical protein
MLKNHNPYFFCINYGYFGFIIKPRGDFNFPIYSLVGCFGFNLLCIPYFSFYSTFDGKDLLGILENF